jgi:hypothetical protein
LPEDTGTEFDFRLCAYAGPFDRALDLGSDESLGLRAALDVPWNAGADSSIG